MRIVILTNIMAPYRVPLFEALGGMVGELTVLLMSKGHENRQWLVVEGKFKSTVLPGLHVRLPGRDVSVHWNSGVIGALRRLEPEVVISGGFAPANIAAFIYCKLFGCKYIGWGELTLKDGANRSVMKRMIRQVLTRWSNGSIASSSVARDAFLFYGAKKDHVKLSLMPIDVEYFRSMAAGFRSGCEYKELRAGLSSPILLSVGRLIRIKGYPELFDIYEKVQMHFSRVTLIIVGDGKDRQQYEEYVQHKGWRNIHFMGFVQSERLSQYYSIADVFVFHTLYDPFGAVLSEAMAAGIPVVSSIHAAATLDLVEEGVTGFRIDPRNSDSAAETVIEAIELSTETRQKIVDSAFEVVRQHDYKCAAKEIYALSRSVTSMI